MADGMRRHRASMRIIRLLFRVGLLGLPGGWAATDDLASRVIALATCDDAELVRFARAYVQRRISSLVAFSGSTGQAMRQRWPGWIVRVSPSGPARLGGRRSTSVGIHPAGNQGLERAAEQMAEADYDLAIEQGGAPLPATRHFERGDQVGAIESVEPVAVSESGGSAAWGSRPTVHASWSPRVGPRCGGRVESPAGDR